MRGSILCCPFQLSNTLLGGIFYNHNQEDTTNSIRIDKKGAQPLPNANQSAPGQTSNNESANTPKHILSGIL